jgi:hypothetical protein
MLYNSKYTLFEAYCSAAWWWNFCCRSADTEVLDWTEHLSENCVWLGKSAFIAVYNSQ